MLASNTTRSDADAVHVRTYLAEAARILGEVDPKAVDEAAAAIARAASGGRVFTLGIGGSASTASHAAGDLRKMCGAEAYHLADNLAEYTARINDDGWDGSLRDMLSASGLAARDAVVIFSVGGGSRRANLSVPLIRAAELAKEVGATVVLIAGRDGGDVAALADVAVVVPPLAPTRVTCHTEGIALVLLHLLVSHPLLVKHAFTWEGTADDAGSTR